MIELVSILVTPVLNDNHDAWRHVTVYGVDDRAQGSFLPSSSRVEPGLPYSGTTVPTVSSLLTVLYSTTKSPVPARSWTDRILCCVLRYRHVPKRRRYIVIEMKQECMRRCEREKRPFKQQQQKRYVLNVRIYYWRKTAYTLLYIHDAYNYSSRPQIIMMNHSLVFTTVFWAGSVHPCIFSKMVNLGRNVSQRDTKFGRLCFWMIFFLLLCVFATRMVIIYTACKNMMIYSTEISYASSSCRACLQYTGLSWDHLNVDLRELSNKTDSRLRK
jgi:hypothetical protein